MDRPVRNLSVTIGVTAFNSEKYIEACLNSLVSQTMDPESIEVVVADDGSVDRTVEVAERVLLQSKFAKYQILTQANSGGPAIGRNRILSSANGEYVYFVDVDDYLGPEAIASMYSLAQKGRADLVVGKYVGVNRGVPKYMFRSTLSRTDIGQTSLMDSMTVLKMFRTDYVRSLSLKFNPRITLGEDHPFTLGVYANSDRIAVQGDVDCYFQVRHPREVGVTSHLTGREREAGEFFKYVHASFAVLADAEIRGSHMVESARSAYWNRLLALDIPNRIIRTRGADREIDMARSLVEKYGARYSVESYNDRASLMLLGLNHKSSAYVLEVCRLVRA